MSAAESVYVRERKQEERESCSGEYGPERKRGRELLLVTVFSGKADLDC